VFKNKIIEQIVDVPSPGFLREDRTSKHTHTRVSLAKATKKNSACAFQEDLI
jgi:hypothetical protein